jgi:predicted transcriptional regulator
MNLENLEITKDLSWFVGFFKGDGYITYGRVAVDTITPEFAEKICEMFSLLTEEKIKVEVYGNTKKFENFLPNNFLQYPSRSPNRSDYVKIRIDSVDFSKDFNQSLENFVNRINEFENEIQLKFVQGFFDAEATVQPNCEIIIDLSKENRYLLELVSNILKNHGILTELKDYKYKLRLRILGGTKRILNITRFQQLINFISTIKQKKLIEILRIYSLPTDKRMREELINEILEVLNKEKKIELWELMIRLDTKYDNLKRCINHLVKENKIKKEKFRKSVIIKLR